MSSKPHNIKGIKVKQKGITIELNMEDLNRNLNNAQYALDSAIMTSMIPYMPMEDGSFINKTRMKSASYAGSGVVFAATPPEGRFLYEGKTMVDEKTGSPWARKGARKVLVSEYTGKTEKRNEKLKYSKRKHRKATFHWFEKAKKSDGESWNQIVAREMKRP